MPRVGREPQRILRLDQARAQCDPAAAIAEAAAAAHRRSFGIYGYRKVHDELQEQQIECCRETVRKLMRENGLFSRVKRKYVVTTDSSHQQPVAPNVLNRQFQATAPNQKWTADITYLATRQGWLYLAIVMDLFSRRIVGWSMSASLEATLVIDPLQMAIHNRRPPAGLMHHSDRGSQYACRDFQHMLEHYAIQCSMSRRGNCYDNAPTESFFGKLKLEWVYGESYASHQEDQQHLFQYLEMFYNRERKHAALGYLSLAAFEESHQSQTSTQAA